MDKDHIHSHPCLYLLTWRCGCGRGAGGLFSPWTGRAGVETTAQNEKKGSEQWMCWVRGDWGAPLREFFSEEAVLKKTMIIQKNIDSNGSYFSWGSFSSTYLVHPLFLYFPVLKLSWKGFRSVLLRLEGRPRCSGSERACWSCCASAWKDEHGVRTWIILLHPVMNTDCTPDREALQSAAPQMKQLPF